LASTAKSLGLSVSTDMPDDVLQLLTLYPQRVRTQSGGGGVDYLPVERRTQRQAQLDFKTVPIRSFHHKLPAAVKRSVGSRRPSFEIAN
jgi:hypothetical protein